MLRAAATFDSQAALGFLVSQISAIEQEVYAIRYADIQYPSLVPVDTSAYPWARTVTYFTADQAGQADWMNGNASRHALRRNRPHQIRDNRRIRQDRLPLHAWKR